MERDTTGFVPKMRASFDGTWLATADGMIRYSVHLPLLLLLLSTATTGAAQAQGRLRLRPPASLRVSAAVSEAQTSSLPAPLRRKAGWVNPETKNDASLRMERLDPQVRRASLARALMATGMTLLPVAALGVYAGTLCRGHSLSPASAVGAGLAVVGVSLNVAASRLMQGVDRDARRRARTRRGRAMVVAAMLAPILTAVPAVGAASFAGCR